MAFKIIANLIVNVAYVFIPSLICYKILKPDKLIDSTGEAWFIAILLLTVAIILSYFLIEFTTNNSIRFIVIILSALGAFFTVITLTPNNPCVMSFVFMCFLFPLFLVYFICFLMVFSLYIRKGPKPVNKEETVK